MVLEWKKVPNNPKMIELFWEGSLLRVVYRFIFFKELKSIPAGITYEGLCLHLAQIELKGGKRYALWLLSRRSLLSSELQEKLSAKAISKESIAPIINYCKGLGFLDDSSQVDRFVASELKKGRSRRAIYSKLTQKGVNPSHLDSLKEISDEEAIDRYLAKHAKKLQSYESRLKVMQKLSRLGFCSDLIRNKVRDN
jgi:SOS response regulatory protein OraA/RecX